MSKFLSRLADLVPVYEEFAAIERTNCGTPEGDRNGASSDMFGKTVRDLGIAAYILRNDIGAFRHHLRESAEIRLQLFQRAASGEAISESFLAMLSYKQLFDSLAAGDYDLSVSLAEVMGGRESIETEHDHPSDRAMGYCLRAVILRDVDSFDTWMPRLLEAGKIGFHEVFMGISTGMSETVSKGLVDALDEHERQSSRGGHFNGTPDELLCVWGIGAANLARSRGLEVSGISPLIPDDLLV